MSDVTQFPESPLSRSIGLSGQLDALAANEVVEAITTPGAGAQEAAKIPGGVLAASVAPALPKRQPAIAPLHEIEEGLMALLDTEAMVSPEQEEAFLQELSTAMQTAKVKRDRVAGFIRECEKEAAFAAEEIKRMQARKKVLTSAAERVRNYVLWIINALDKKKLEGDKFTFSTRALPPAFEVTDERLIPIEYKSAIITVPAEWYLRWRTLLLELGMPVDTKAVFAVDSDRVKQALDAVPVECGSCGGRGKFENDPFADMCEACAGSGVVPPSVPGATLITDRRTLVLR